MSLKSSLKLLSCGSVLLSVTPAQAATHFDSAFFSDDPKAIADLNQVEKSGEMLPGEYSVDVWLNNAFLARRKITFIYPTGKDGAPVANASLTPRFTLQDLTDLGVKTEAFPALSKLHSGDTADLVHAIAASTTRFDITTLRLDISIPQAALRNNARGYIPPEQWDQGINALFLNYNLTGNKDWYDSGSSESNFLTLQSGLNLGAWRLRDNSTWSYNKDSAGTSDQNLEHISTYVERTVIPLQSELTAGDISSRGDLFDSVPVRGVKLETDDKMLPDSQKGFAPTIRGIAKSNAKVVIKQNGYNLYQTYVPPGPFEINDLFPTSSSGDLQVVVEESDGSKQNYTIPYSSVPGLQREGHIKYSVIAGKYHSNSDQQNEDSVGQGTLYWGGPWGMTLYGGSQFSDNYLSFAAGFSKNLGYLGAVAVDITQASSTLADDSQHHGESVRFLYDKSLNSLGTTLNLMGYRYSTEGYYTLSDTTYTMMSGYNHPDDDTDDNHNGKDDDEPDYADYYNLWYTKKGKLQLSINQTLGEYGSLYVSGTQQSYWHTDEKDSYVQCGYNTSLHDVSLGLNYSYNKSMGQPESDQVFSLNISLPLGKWLSPDDGDITHQQNNAYLTYSNSLDAQGKMTQLAGLSGTLLERNNLSYTVQQGYANQGEGNTGNTNLYYQGTYSNLSAGYNYGTGYHQVNYGASGGLVLHRDGLTLSQPLGDTNILVAVPGANNVTVENGTGITTDWRGYAVIPYATEYRQNHVSLDALTLSQHTDVDESAVDVVPTQGAMVRATFTPHIGVRALMTLKNQGKPLPFGATVTRADNQEGSIVGDGGQLYLSALPLSGKLNAQWGNGPGEHCVADYALPEKATSESITLYTGECVQD